MKTTKQPHEYSSTDAEHAPKVKPLQENDIRAWLQEQDKEKLVELLMCQTRENETFLETLKMYTARGTRRPDSLKDTIDRTLDPDYFIDYRASWDYARAAQRLIGTIRAILDDGYPSEVIELAEHALRAIARVLHHMDDSNGNTSDLMGDLMEIHLQACLKAKPDSKELARRLFAWEMESEWEVFYGAVERYKDVLVKEGTKVYRELAQQEWDKVRPLKPGEKDSEKYGWRFHITAIMNGLANIGGSLDERLAVMSRDLSCAYNFLKIAEVCQEAGERDRALEWAEKGLEAFPHKTDSRLREFAAQQYHRRKRHEEAVGLVWLNFMDHACLENYIKLEASAEKLQAWEVWRERALSEIRKGIKPRKAPVSCRSGWGDGGQDASLLVEIFLWEKDPDTAWREANGAGCANSWWLELAQKRTAEHPQEALWVYQQQIEPLIGRKNNQSYHEAIEYIGKVRHLLSRLGKENEFAELLTSLRIQHKPKRNFIAFLDSKKWT